MALRTTTKYQDNDDNVRRIVLSADYAAQAGTPPTGAIDVSGTVKVSKSTRAYGIKPRGVRLSRIIGTSPNQFKKYAFLPVLTQTAFDSSTYDVGATITIGSVAWTVAKKIGEDTD